jgi:hypothetical protein
MNIDEIDYKNKYLKYKNKYLSLKNLSDSSNFFDIFNKKKIKNLNNYLNESNELINKCNSELSNSELEYLKLLKDYKILLDIFDQLLIKYNIIHKENESNKDKIIKLSEI